MNDRPRAMLGIIFSLGLLATLAPGAQAGLPAALPGAEPLVRHVELLYVAANAAAGHANLGADLAGVARQQAAARGPCRDGAYKLEGASWRSTYRWWFRAGSTPGGLSRANAEKTLKRGVNNIVNARNDCGRAAQVSARAKYRGRTKAVASCKRTDGRNVVGFRRLPAGVAARACWWMQGNRIVEADVQINSTIRWATSLASCTNQLMLEAVMTHEAGHVFGLGHVGERRHGRQTMSTYIDGPCNNQESTLGLGDLRGLEALYP